MKPVENAAEMELFRSADLLVRAVGQGRSDVCVVTFACLLDPPGLDRPGFGEDFFRSRGIDAVHVTCVGNHWYQYPDLFAALDAVRAATEPYRRVLAYGSSMGGYAAVRYGGRAGAHEALAISPQFSIDARRVPFETRWRRLAGAIRFLHEVASPAIGLATVVYDPVSPDARHADLIAAAVPTVPILLIHAGHPTSAYLAETGLLTGLVLAFCAGEDTADFARRARTARRRSGQYLFSLARRVPRRRLDLKLALARRTVEAVPSEPVYLSYLGVVLEAAGDSEGADAAHRAAVALEPDTPVVPVRLARFLLRRGRAREALALASYGSVRGARQERHLLCVALLVDGQVLRAARAGIGGLSPLLCLDLLTVVAWRPMEPGWRLRCLSVSTDRLRLHFGIPDELRSADIPSARISPRAVSAAFLARLYGRG